MVGRLFSAKIENKTRVGVTVEVSYAAITGDATATLIQNIQPESSHSFAAKKADNDSQMYISKINVNDGQKRDNTFSGPFVDQDKDKKVIVIVESENSKDFEIQK
ncbi:hypothetical protein AKO1_009185 [Acrasis kona]|uniref:Uncharacterized protein n=1 Tax=Acrasis kona TaxID=1008807 RepID=A0AAW2ZJU9_9EUKA